MAFAPTYQNLAMSSFILWLQNLLISKGGYDNVGTRFYPGNPIYNGYQTFSAPYKPIIFDNSYPGPNILTGIYFNNSYLTLNQSGFAGVDSARSNVYFTGSNTPSFTNCTISGNYSVLEYNVIFPSPDIGLIFEGKMELRPRTSLNNSTSGLRSDQIPYPCILVRSESFRNDPWEFGGVDLTTTNVGLYVFSNSVYSFDSLRSILVDQKTNHIALLSAAEMPTNNINSLKSGNLFNYTGVANISNRIGSGNAMWIKDVTITDFNGRGFLNEVKSLSNDVYFGVIEFELCKDRIT
jgi:hypothetical protein